MSTFDSLKAPWAAMSRLHKIVALILALILLVTWWFGRNGSFGCPTAGVAATAAAPVAAVAAPAVVAASPASLALDWANGKLTLTGVVKDDATKKALYDAAVKKMGDASRVVDQVTVSGQAPAFSFADKFGDLVGWGVDGRAVKVAGNNVVLTGQVPVEGDKKQRGEAASLYFGSGYTIDNQIVVKAPEKVAPVSLFFDTAKFNVQADAKNLLAKLVEYANASPNSKLQLTGYHDKRGNPESNKELAKNRAKAVRDLLKTAGVAEDRVILVPPVELVGAADDAQARRVDVSVAQ
jgi:outer membrane protein OmpA-like peptidoglycan-associated protein